MLVVAEWPEPVLAALPAVAAILLAVITAYHWQDNVARCAVTGEALSAELARFVTRARPEYRQADEIAVSKFMDRIAGLRMGEVADWRAAFLKQVDVAKPDNRDKGDVTPPLASKVVDED